MKEEELGKGLFVDKYDRNPTKFVGYCVNICNNTFNVN